MVPALRWVRGRCGVSREGPAACECDRALPLQTCLRGVDLVRAVRQGHAGRADGQRQRVAHARKAARNGAIPYLVVQVGEVHTLSEDAVALAVDEVAEDRAGEQRSASDVRRAS